MIDWIRAHPALFWGIVTAILTTLFKPQTPEAYAKLAMRSQRLADFWRLVGSLGIDPVKAVLLVRELVSPTPPTLYVVTNPPPKLEVVDEEDMTPTHPGIDP